MQRGRRMVAWTIVVATAPALAACATGGQVVQQAGAPRDEARPLPPPAPVETPSPTASATGDVDWLPGTPAVLRVGVRHASYESVEDALRDERMIVRACAAWAHRCTLVPAADTADHSVLVWISNGLLKPPTRGETVLARTGSGQVVNAGIVIDRDYGARPDSIAPSVQAASVDSLWMRFTEFPRGAPGGARPSVPRASVASSAEAPRDSIVGFSREDRLRYRVIAHELGHAMGLRHSRDIRELMAPSPTVFEVTPADRARLEQHLDRQQRPADPPTVETDSAGASAAP